MASKKDREKLLECSYFDPVFSCRARPAKTTAHHTLGQEYTDLD